MGRSVKMVFSDVFLGFLNQHKHPEDTYNTNGPTDRATLVFLKDQVFCDRAKSSTNLTHLATSSTS